ncbi:MAG: hypothetical protein ACYDC5_07595 [Candidatus Dormibacteria bacterium]
MITVVSHPPDLSKWDQSEHPYYLELYGEAQPTLDMSYAEVIPPGGPDAKTVQSTPIYEYWWTLGHGGTAPHHRHLFEPRGRDGLWETLEDIAARVYVFFPIAGGWRVKELIASAKYLSPVQDQKTWTEKAGDDWQRMQPIVATAGQVASTLGVVPGVGAVAAGAAPILGALSKLQIGNVPQGVSGFDWYVEKVTFGSETRGLMQGVVWALPKEMFIKLGGRLTGSVALSFIPSVPVNVSGPWTPKRLPMLAHACVYADGGEHWVPAKNDFIELPIAPALPPGARPDQRSPGSGSSTHEPPDVVDDSAIGGS